MPTPPAAAAGGLASALHLTPPGAAQCAQQRPSIRHGKSGGGGRRGGGGRNQFNYVDTETVNINTFSSPSHADLIPAKMESGRGSPAQAGHVCGAEWGGSGAAVGHTGPLGHTLRHNQAPHHLARAHGAGRGRGSRHSRDEADGDYNPSAGEQTRDHCQDTSVLTTRDVNRIFTMPREDPFQVLLIICAKTW